MTARRQTKATLSLKYVGINGRRLSSIAHIERRCFLEQLIFNWLVDVTGIEPVTPCLQRRATQETDDLAGDGLNEREIAKVTTIKDY
jgi:hypothetical protein